MATRGIPWQARRLVVCHDAAMARSTVGPAASAVALTMAPWLVVACAGMPWACLLYTSDAADE